MRNLVNEWVFLSSESSSSKVIKWREGVMGHVWPVSQKRSNNQGVRRRTPSCGTERLYLGHLTLSLGGFCLQDNVKIELYSWMTSWCPRTVCCGEGTLWNWVLEPYLYLPLQSSDIPRHNIHYCCQLVSIIIHIIWMDG